MNIRTRSPARAGVGLALAGLLMAAPALAAGERSADIKAGPNVTLGIKIWASQGDMTWNHNASAVDSRFGNPTSRLTYQDIDSTVAEIMGHIRLPQRFYLELVWGSGDIDEGTLVDDDFLSAVGAQFFGASRRGEHLFSRTHSDVNDDGLHYYSLKLGRDVFRSQDRRGGIGLFGKYQVWTEETRAVGVRQIVCTTPRLCQPVGFAGFANTDVIENDVDWDSLFIGVDGYYKFNDKFTVSGMLAYSPIAQVESEDIHFLRSDLAKNPSFRLEGDGETINAEVNLNYVPIVGSVGLLYLLSVFFIAASLAVGLFFSTLAKTQQQAMQMSTSPARRR